MKLERETNESERARAVLQDSNYEVKTIESIVARPPPE